MAELALDHEDGVRPARRQRSDLGLATARLYPDRRCIHRRRHADACRQRRRLDRVRPPRPALYSRRDADRGRDRDPGRRRRCDVDRSRFPRRRRRQAAAGGRYSGRAGHGSGARPPCARYRNPVGGGNVGMACAIFGPGNGVSPRSHCPGHLNRRRPAHSGGNQRAAANGLAHPRRRHCIWIYRYLRSASPACHSGRKSSLSSRCW